MTAATVLVVVALVQGAFLTLLLMFLLTRRLLFPSTRDRFAEARAAIDEAVRQWLVAEGPVSAVRDAISALPSAARVGYVAHLARGLVPAEQRPSLVTALRYEPWVRQALAGARSRRWSRRLEAARALAFVGTAGDRQLLGTLLADPHPAVAVAAVSALPGVADDGLVAQVVDAYPSLSPFVRGFLDLTLRELREPVTRALVSRMRMDAPTLALARRIALAEALDLLPVLDQAMALRGHVDADVRAAVARAARRLPRDATVQLLARMTRDADVTVRVEAARSLGELGPGSVPFLGGALHDTSWRVRRQAALSLALLGERGRLALREARADADPYVRDIASLVSGLSDGALLEITAR